MYVCEDCVIYGDNGKCVELCKVTVCVFTVAVALCFSDSFGREFEVILL